MGLYSFLRRVPGDVFFQEFGEGGEHAYRAELPAGASKTPGGLFGPGDDLALIKTLAALKGLVDFVGYGHDRRL
jgi:hypothetical protein